MYLISASALGALLYFYLTGKRKTAPQEDGIPPATETAEAREIPEESGKEKPGDLPTDLTALKKVKNPLKRHLLYTYKMDAAYKIRKTESEAHDLVIEYGQAYVDDFKNLESAVLEHFGDAPKVVTPFKQLAIVLEEDQSYDLAMTVCKAALKLGIEDGTKTGYKGRMERILKKKQATV
ncbi:MAG: hypothetical protein ABIJ31_13960 [Pseudomonadota bacterium]